MSAVPNDKAAEARPIASNRALVPFVPARPGMVWPSAQALSLVAIFGLALGTGGAGMYGLRHVLPWPQSSEAAASSAMLHKVQDEIGRLQASVAALRTTSDTAKSDETLRGLKRTVDAMRQDVDQVRSNGATTIAQLSAKIDKVDHDPNPKLAEIATRLDRIERTRAADAAPLKPAEPRQDRTDKTVAASSAPLVTGSIPVPRPVIQALANKPQPAAPAKAETVRLPASEPKPTASRPPSVDSWVLRDVYDGMALVEARNGGLREVEPGQYLPGAGQIRSIERRGRGWVVVTNRGVIDDTTF